MVGHHGAQHDVGKREGHECEHQCVAAAQADDFAEDAVYVHATHTHTGPGAGKAGKAMKDLGVSAFDNNGNFIGLEATLQQVNTALAGCTEEQRNAYLAAIGGKTHVDALNALMAGLNTEVGDGVSEWQALQQELEKLELVRKSKIGSATLTAIRVRPLVENTMRLMLSDPERWLNAEFRQWVEDLRQFR